MGYIRLPRVYEKMKEAEQSFTPVLFTAACGYGKTAAVRHFYRRKRPCVLFCREGRLSGKPDLDTLRANIVIIEDMQWLHEEEDIRYLKELLKAGGRQVVMLSRGHVPGFLSLKIMDGSCVRIQESDLALGEKEVEAFFQVRRIPLPAEVLPQLTAVSRGYALALNLYAARMANGERFGDTLVAEVWQDVFQTWDACVFQQNPEDYVRLVLSVCPYEQFDVKMLSYLLEETEQNCARLLEYAWRETNQIDCVAEGVYALRPEVRRYYLWYRVGKWEEEKKRENYRRAGEYFEKKEDYPHALQYYREAGDRQRMLEILTHLAEEDSGAWRYPALQKYFEELPREVVRESPVLMTAMAMMYMLLMKLDQAEEWYGALRKYAGREGIPKKQQQEAQIRLLYLDLSLPQRSRRTLVYSLQKLVLMAGQSDLRVPEVLLTGENPSIINGGRDFTAWSGRSREVLQRIMPVAEKILGRYVKGFETVALAECGFERGTMPAEEVLERCADGYAAASCDGKLEICYAAAGIQARQYLILGCLPEAERILKEFQIRALKEGSDLLLNNLTASLTRIALYAGGTEEITAFLKKTPHARVSFTLSDRYLQLVRLRCLIAQNHLEEALDLSFLLTQYFSSCQREYCDMVNELLKSIILYRLQDRRWIRHFADVLHKTGTHHFVRLLSLEGAAVLPLLQNLPEESLPKNLSAKYLEQVTRGCNRMASVFPDYLAYIPTSRVHLTRREMQVLGMLCSGETSEEICRELGISYAGLKKHNRNIYQKIGAKNRAEAERKAAQMGLVYTRHT